MKVVLSLVSTERSNRCLVYSALLLLLLNRCLVCSAHVCLLRWHRALLDPPLQVLVLRGQVLLLLLVLLLPVALLRRFLVPALDRRVGVGFSASQFLANMVM